LELVEAGAGGREQDRFSAPGAGVRVTDSDVECAAAVNRKPSELTLNLLGSRPDQQHAFHFVS
jgi:hypothetical protein